MKKYLTIVFLAMAISTVAQQKEHDYSAIDTANWVFPKTPGFSYDFETYQGAKALMLKKNFNSPKGAFIAYPKDTYFRDGEIELDMASTTGQDFIGVAFRIRDANHYETLYFRPASSGSIHAIQYMPAKKDEFDWWDYESDKYQAKATLPSKGWFHAKIVVKGSSLSVYVDDQSTPAMVRNDLDTEFKSGFAGVWFGNSTACAYKNLTIKNYQ
jgi:hypothetical protein